jgi:excisionase family DNA binding protein
MGTSILLVHEVARLLGTTERRARLLADTGQLPAVRTSTGTRIFERADVERFADRRGQPAAELAETR